MVEHAQQESSKLGARQLHRYTRSNKSNTQPRLLKRFASARRHKVIRYNAPVLQPAAAAVAAAVAAAAAAADATAVAAAAAAAQSAPSGWGLMAMAWGWLVYYL